MFNIKIYAIIWFYKQNSLYLHHVIIHLQIYNNDTTITNKKHSKYYLLNTLIMDEITKYKEGFNAGWQQLRQKDVAECRKEICKVLGVNNRNSFIYYKNGNIEPKVSQAFEIEKIFKKYGITNIWGKGK